MDKKSLKSVVVGYKMGGMSYADIATKLEEEYGVKMSRQAVNGLYKRATSDKEIEKNWNTVIKTNEICFYHALGYSVKEIKDILQNDNFDISLGRIGTIITDNSDHIEDIEKSLVENIEKGLRDKDSIDEIIKKTKFKDVGVKNKKWETLLNTASKQYVKDKITEALADIIDVTNDRDLVRSMMKEYNVDTTFREIGQKLRD